MLGIWHFFTIVYSYIISKSSKTDITHTGNPCARATIGELAIANFYKVVAAINGDKVDLQAKVINAQPTYSQEQLGNFMAKLITYGLAFNAYNFYVPELHSKKPGHNVSAKAMQGFIEKSNPTFTMTISLIKTRTGRKFPSPKLVISTLPAPSLQVQPNANLTQEIEI